MGLLERTVISLRFQFKGSLSDSHSKIAPDNDQPVAHHNMPDGPSLPVQDFRRHSWSKIEYIHAGQSHGICSANLWMYGYMYHSTYVLCIPSGLSKFSSSLGSLDPCHCGTYLWSTSPSESMSTGPVGPRRVRGRHN